MQLVRMPGKPRLIPGLLTEWCRLSRQDPDYWPALKGPGISCDYRHHRYVEAVIEKMVLHDNWSCIAPESKFSYCFRTGKAQALRKES